MLFFLEDERRPDQDKVDACMSTARKGAIVAGKLEKVLATAEHKPEALESERWFSILQRAKVAKFASVGKVIQSENYMSAEDAARAKRLRDAAERQRKTQAEQYAKYKKSKSAGKPSTYNYHPSVTASNKDKVFSIISAFSGYSAGKIDQLVRGVMKKYPNTSLTEACVQVWRNSPLREDKPMVSIDLEVASPTDSNKIDMGPYSNIIEVGLVKRDVDGTITKMSFLNGVPEDFERAYGTGAEHIHNISTDDIDGYPLFIEDKENTDKLLEFLQGSVMVAHNASYEISQLKHNLFGFTKMLNGGEIEVLDTRAVCTYFLPHTPNNTNQGFVEGVGLTYENAHRALADAEMTLRALLTHRKIDSTGI